MTRLRLSDDRGFAMVEAIMAAILLVIVALGVLRGLDVAGHSSGREKARSAAAALTEEDQERLRSFRAVDLANYDQTRTVTVNGVDYSVESQVDWVRDSTGGTQSCNNSATQADYMRITSTTTSRLVNTPIAPIKMSSLVAPPVGAFGANQGTLGIQVNDRNGVGVPDIDVKIAGPTTITNPTNSAGCAIFAYVPVGAYTASLNTAGWVDKGGNQNASVGATVSNGTVNVKNMFYDQASSVDVTFDTETRDNATIAAQTMQLSASNAGVPSGPFAPFNGQRVWDPTGGATGAISATSLFPFTDGYGLYGGGCPSEDPSANDSDFYTSYPSMFTSVTAGQASAPVKVRLPSINLQVLFNGAPLSETYRPYTRVLVTSIASAGTTCTEQTDFPAPATEAPVAPATVGSGFMIKSALPFGNYKVCVQSRTSESSPSTQIRSKTITGVKNWFYKGMKPPDIGSPTIDLKGASSTSGACT